jgi:hypothetical protein
VLPLAGAEISVYWSGPRETNRNASGVVNARTAEHCKAYASDVLLGCARRWLPHALSAAPICATKLVRDALLKRECAMLVNHAPLRRRSLQWRMAALIKLTNTDYAKWAA